MWKEVSMKKNHEEYIHFGATKLREIDKISDCIIGKPRGGLWASRVNADYGWKDWCYDNEFADCNVDNSFKFTLQDNAKILEVHKYDDVKKYIIENELFSLFPTFDFVKIFQEYDGMELFLSDDFSLRFNGFYAWDCDSIVIWNKDIINVI